MFHYDLSEMKKCYGGVSCLEEKRRKYAGVTTSVASSLDFVMLSSLRILKQEDLCQVTIRATR
jgi:hypothetical protein